MTAAHAAGRRTRARGYVVSAFFEGTEDVERALARLNEAGLPRDRVEVVVTPEVAERFYSGRGRRNRREAFRYAAIGGLTGLVIGAMVSIALVAWPGFQDPGLIAWVQLLGPNYATIGGAVIGAVIGWFRKRPPEPWHARLRERTSGILVATLTRSEGEAAHLAHLLRESGGVEVRTEAR